LAVGEQQQKLNQKLQGHYAYYGITGNAPALLSFRRMVRRIWRKWLCRRHRGRTLTWTIFARLEASYPLAPARVVHSIYKRP
jgi:hypothetical protein